MIEFSRRHDGNFNVWALMNGVDEGWTIVGVHKTHQEALVQVRELRAAKRAGRDND